MVPFRPEATEDSLRKKEVAPSATLESLVWPALLAGISREWTRHRLKRYASVLAQGSPPTVSAAKPAEPYSFATDSNIANSYNTVVLPADNLVMVDGSCCKNLERKRDWEERSFGGDRSCCEHAHPFLSSTTIHILPC